MAASSDVQVKVFRQSRLVKHIANFDWKRRRLNFHNNYIDGATL
jgi:hypothetical protein